MLKIVAEDGYSIGDRAGNCKKKAPAAYRKADTLRRLLCRGRTCAARGFKAVCVSGKVEGRTLHAKRYHRFVYPINFSSTTAAVSRPSRSAHTTRL